MEEKAPSNRSGIDEDSWLVWARYGPGTAEACRRVPSEAGNTQWFQLSCGGGNSQVSV